MIDIEREVYTKVARTLRAEFPGIDVSGTYVASPSTLPHVSFEETDNYCPEQYIDNGDTQKFSVVTYTANVYSNKTTGRKQECRKILAKIDDMMYAMNFVCVGHATVPNLEDSTICRMTANYRAVTDGEHLYRR